MNRVIEINNRPVGPGYPVYVIAEMSANHNQDLVQALNIVGAAAEAGADAIKVQTYTPNTLTIDCGNDHFQIKETLWEGQTLYDLYNTANMPWEWHQELKQVANELGLDYFSTAYDETSVDFLEEIGVPAYKVASFELVDVVLIRKIARTGRPIILSTGMATLAEIEEAVITIQETGGEKPALLKCTSAYPALPEDMNLRTIPCLAEIFDVPVGLSDHTLGIAVPVAAVALGACIVEKHFTLSRQVPGPDSAFSLEPHEFKAMVEAIRVAEKALGAVRFEVSEREQASRVFRRSLFVVQDMAAGEVFTHENVRSIRPGHGLHTRHMEEVLGRKAAKNIRRGTQIKWELIR